MAAAQGTFWARMAAAPRTVAVMVALGLITVGVGEWALGRAGVAAPLRLGLHALSLSGWCLACALLREVRAANRRHRIEQQQVETEARVRAAALYASAAYLVNLQEDERARLARELHDEMGALLTSSKLELMRVRRVPGAPTDVLQKLGALELQINQAITLKRSIIENLRPSSLDHLGLSQTLVTLCETASASLQIPVHCTVRDVPLDKDAQLAVYRLVQCLLEPSGEASGKGEISVTLALANGGVQIDIRREGDGVDAHAGKTFDQALLGLRLRMEARGGTLVALDAATAGHCVRAWLPASTTVTSTQPTWFDDGHGTSLTNDVTSTSTRSDAGAARFQSDH